jgi:hypothetical protein
MNRQTRRSKQLTLLTLLAFLLAGLPAAIAMPQPAMAQSPTPASTDAPAEEEPTDDEIVYIDSNGYIKVLDPYQLPGNREIMWVSPDNNWRNAALGDFNGDGDMEIVAVGGGSDDDNNDNGRLVIYDPVVSTGSTVGLPTINGIPWEKLYERSIDGKPTIVAGGNFDDNIDADEILFGYFMQDEAKLPGKDEIFRITVIKNANPVPDGRAWTDHIPRKDDGNEWSYVTVGNVDQQGTDEVALLDEDGGEVNVFKIGNGFERFFGDSSSKEPYRAVAFGNIYSQPQLQVLMSRQISSRENLFIYRYNPEKNDLYLLSGDTERFNPYPRFIWVADVNGSGDDEFFFIRRDKDPRLVGRNRGNDGVIILEDNLENNDFRVGVGGDFDGDGKDEIAIASEDRIYLYPELDRNMNRDEYDLPTNRRTLQAGDLDAEGFLPGPAFGLRRLGGSDENIEIIKETLETGLQGPTRGYQLRNIGSPATIPFTYAVEDNPAWLTISVSSDTITEQAPADVFLQFDARGLLPGDYRTALIFTSSNPDVLNSPFRVPVDFTVEVAAVRPNPESVSVIYYPCVEPLEKRQSLIQMDGSPGVVYNASIMDTPQVTGALAALNGEIVSAYIDDDGVLVMEDSEGQQSSLTLPANPRLMAAGVDSITWPSDSPWVSATSETGIIPDTITLNVDPAQRRADTDEAVLIIVADKSAGSAPTNVRIVPIRLMCANGQVFLPAVRRNLSE